jgi:uncharacterized membrane protein YjjP (DUF1212 family)
MSDPLHEFLIDAAVLLHRHGTPSHRLERVMTKVARSLGIEGVFLYTPTALVVSLHGQAGEQTYMRRVDSGPIDVDKLIRFDAVLGEVEAGRVTVAAAREQMAQIASAPSPYSSLLTTIACAVSCGAVAVFFRGGMVEIMSAALIGLVVAGLDVLQSRRQWERGFLEPLAGFAAAVGSLAIARWIHPMDDRLVTLASLIVLLPGLQLTVGLTELALGHLSAGVARLAGATATLLTLIIGVAIGWRIAGDWRTIPDPPAAPLPEWCTWAAILIAPIMFAIVFRARWPQWPVIIAISVAGFWTSQLVSESMGQEVAAFAGALVVGCGANLYARLRDRPALVAQTPGLIVLVPGSIGYRSLTALIDRATIEGVDLAFLMIMIAVSLVGGLLTANALIPPRRIL